MSNFYYHPAAQASIQPTAANISLGNSHSNAHHGGRSRRNGRFSSSNSAAKAFHQQQQKPVRIQREQAEELQFASWRKDFEAARSFDLDDDELFCPWHLLTEDDLHSIGSASSDRSSSSGGSPQTSPLQPQVHPTSAFSLSAANVPHLPAAMHHAGNAHLKIHQPMAQRTRNAIPIVDPNSRNVSPPSSISPGRHSQKTAYVSRRW